MRPIFTVDDRERVRARVLELARADSRVVAGAEVGSFARDTGDRWSDLDLTFAVADGVELDDVLADWTAQLADELGAAHLFDLRSGPAIYRVFLLPDCLEIDVSFAPASDFGARGPAFRLLFGRAVESTRSEPPPANELFGYAVHHARAARVSVERGRYWLAEYWISAARDYALALACRARGLPTAYGRGFDDLPADVLARFEGAIVRSLDRDELMRALGAAIEGLLHESTEARELATTVRPQLRTLASASP